MAFQRRLPSNLNGKIKLRGMKPCCIFGESDRRVARKLMTGCAIVLGKLFEDGHQPGITCVPRSDPVRHRLTNCAKTNHPYSQRLPVCFLHDALPLRVVYLTAEIGGFDARVFTKLRNGPIDHNPAELEYCHTIRDRECFTGILLHE